MKPKLRWSRRKGSEFFRYRTLHCGKIVVGKVYYMRRPEKEWSPQEWMPVCYVGGSSWITPMPLRKAMRELRERVEFNIQRMEFEG